MDKKCGRGYLNAGAVRRRDTISEMASGVILLWSFIGETILI
jgi:hypothetical protein